MMGRLSFSRNVGFSIVGITLSRFVIKDDDTLYLDFDFWRWCLRFRLW
jgi:hypothetical protein